MVPASVAQMTNLEVLYLTDQKITSIPSFIGDLKNLKEIRALAELFDNEHLRELAEHFSRDRGVKRKAEDIS